VPLGSSFTGSVSTISVYALYALLRRQVHEREIRPVSARTRSRAFRHRLDARGAHAPTPNAAFQQRSRLAAAAGWVETALGLSKMISNFAAIAFLPHASGCLDVTLSNEAEQALTFLTRATP